MDKLKDSEASLRDGLEKGYQETKTMFSTKSGKLTILAVLASMFWLLFITPATCMKLEKAFPQTGIWFFAGLAMYCSWFVALFMIGQVRRKQRNIRLFGKTNPSFKEFLSYIRKRNRQ